MGRENRAVQNRRAAAKTTIRVWIDNDWKNRYLIESFEDAERWFEMYPMERYVDKMSFHDEWNDSDVKNEFLKAYDDYLSLKKQIDDLEIKWF